MKRIGHALVLACLLLFPCRPAAGEWTADVVDTEWFPKRSVAVDKKAQSFFLLSRQSPVRVAEFLPCATGQLLGDKLKEGDLRTPEGVYFIVRRKASGLNYELYGDLAFPLNFPNPADVVRKKTGHGIWIHGRGNAIIPYETQGCVALNTPDLHRLDNELALGMPVIIADELRLAADAPRLKAEAKEVVDATQAWGKAWSERSEAFFGFHDAEKFAISEGQPFAAFRGQKERLFKSLPWIQVTLSDIRALPGPDYWVTYFLQVYRSPTLVSQGIKRLYWQRGNDGRFRIIGMEYEEAPTLLADRGKTGKALANEAETVTTPPDAPSEEEVQARQLMDAHQAAMEKVAQKAFHSLPLKAQPTPEDHAILEVAQTGAAKPGVSPFASDAMKVSPPPPAAMQQPSVAAAPASPVPAVPVQVAQAPQSSAAHQVAPVPAIPAPPAPAAVAAPQPAVVAPATPAKTAPPAVAAAPPVSPERAAEIRSVVESWRTAWERGRIDDYLAHYAEGAVQGSLKGKDAIRRQKSGLWQGHAPGRVSMEVLAAAPEGDGFAVVCAMDYQGKGGGRESAGFKTLVLVPAGGRLIISKERWSKHRPDIGPAPAALPAGQAAAAPAPGTAPAKPAPAVAETPKAGPPAAEPAKVASPAQVAAEPVIQAPAPAVAAKPAPPTKAEREAAAAAMVEAWRGAWERGRITEYASFYAESAIQGDRRGREAIRAQKADLWKDKAPRKVAFSDMKISPRRDGFVATFVQDYEGRDGSADKGRKTLYLAPSGSGFTIVEEKWSRM
jgi:murein L,D-transpeptidase YafK